MPPGYGYLIGSVGAVGVLAFLVDLRRTAALWTPFELLGRHSLLVYLVHFPAIQLIIHALGERVAHGPYLAIYAGLIAALCALAAGVDAARRRLDAGAAAAP